MLKVYEMFPNLDAFLLFIWSPDSSVKICSHTIWNLHGYYCKKIKQNSNKFAITNIPKELVTIGVSMISNKIS